jgi:transposase
MKKRSSNVVRIKTTVIEDKGEVVCGLDLGDRFSLVWLIGKAAGEAVGEDRVATTPAALTAYFGKVPPMRIALEVGTHSPWVSRLLTELGHDVLVANARKVRLISQNRSKDDRIDAEYLARLARVDPKLLAPIRHRGPQAQVDLAVLRSRNALVKARTGLINHVRGVVKATGHRLPGASAESFAATAMTALPPELRQALAAVLDTIAALSATIRTYEDQLTALATHSYPETALLRQVHGVGLLTSLAFVLTIEDPARFRRSRNVGAYFGLVRARQRSGDSDPELHITKHGDPFMRKLLVGCAHHILGPFGKDCDLRRYGEALAAGGSKRAKKRAVVAVARKLAVVLHRLWVDHASYNPFYNLNRARTSQHAA